jgi:hypothetical protein
LSAGQWYYEPELMRVSAFVGHWLTELAREGREVKETAGGARLVRPAHAAR